MEDSIILTVSFFTIALIYSSVGFGGGSSYLALLAIMGVEFLTLKATGLLCNIIVVSGGVFIFYKEGFIDFRKFWPFIVLSIPLSFLGGYWKLEASTFFLFLGFSLVVAAVVLWIQPGQRKNTLPDNTILNVALGGGIGFLSGLVGIGGGIFLSPILHFIYWDTAKRISALASVFILANSISGLSGLLTQDVTIDWIFILPLLIAVFLGGQIGSRLGSRTFNPIVIKRVTALVIFLAALNILKDHF